ncbi:MAG: LytTR family DNA-binding domain-containing protein [Gammaproteobacteria bacterium]|nr:DNA-binding response regulator [Gammaproteobacteria bacterium]
MSAGSLAGAAGVIRALVAEDERPARDKLARMLEELGATVVARCVDGIDAARAIEELQPDVALLDIQMPGIGGLELVAQLDGERAPLVVFVTAFDEHAVRAFELNAVDYLLKPYDKERLAQALARVKARLKDGHSRHVAVSVARAQVGAAERLLVPDGELLRLIETASIEYLEADDNYVHIHTATKRFVLRRTLQDLLAQLGEGRFARIHKSVAVNIAAIESFAPLFKGDYLVKVTSGRELRMSRRYKDALFERLAGRG